MSQDWKRIAAELGASFAERAAGYDDGDRFVVENYGELKQKKIFSMAVPSELGGGGAKLSDTCELLRELGKHCGSTALALSMHQHLLAAAVVRHLKGMPAAPLLKKVAESEAVLVSTGASDWIDANGSAERVEGGYRVNAKKIFGSGSPSGDVMITSVAWNSDPEGPSVLHFSLPLKSEGVKVQDDWRTLGMRGTGSHTIAFENVFVPEGSISLKRPQGKWHAAWDIACNVALPIFMSAYIGVAEAAAELALERAKSKPVKQATLIAVGEMENARTAALLAWQDMVNRSANYDFPVNIESSNAQLVRKTLASKALRQTVEKAMEVAGGSAFFRKLPLERMWRDVQGSPYHPLPENRQLLYTGGVRLGVERFWDV
ncbi:MAG TPA: acyl-CoA dehydrogenase family protein [Polyangiaceae bacterium]|jgi:alkylation response protein AidB-like acyl-CoA dehydrogenase